MVQRVLIYRLGSIGDTIIALPALRLVARKYPNAERRILTNEIVNHQESPVQSVLENTDLVHGYFTYPLKTRDLKKISLLRRQIKQWNPQVLVYLTATRGLVKTIRDALFFKWCGIPKLIGVPYLTGSQTPRKLPHLQHYEHEAGRLCRCLVNLGVIDMDNPMAWSLELTNDERSKAEKILSNWNGARRFIAICPGAKVDVKDWGMENWQEALKRLSERYPEIGLVSLGSDQDAEKSEELSLIWKAPVLNLCGQLSPRESAAILERAIVFLGHDSGPMHLSASVGTPCVAVFSARNYPGEWFPLGKKHHVLYHQTPCFGCRKITCSELDKVCIRSIPVEDVVKGAIKIIEGE